MSADLFGDAPIPTPPQLKKSPRAHVTIRKSKNTKPRNVGVKRRTGGASKMLELAVTAVKIAGFLVYDNTGEYRAAQKRGTLPQKYVVKHYSHPALYGTKGRKEGFISHEGTDYILEAKYQSGSGSVDEKLPYVFEHFLSSPIANWLLWLDGDLWRKKARGIAAVAYIRKRAAEQCPPGRRLVVVVGIDEGMDFLADEFGGGA